MNKVMLMGRLTRDPEIRYGKEESSTKIAKFSLAVDRKFKRSGEAEADFFNCTAFGKQADFVEHYLKQGTKMLVIGRIQNDNYVNREGIKVYSVQILVDELEFAESKNASTGTSQNMESNYQQPITRPEPSQAIEDGFINIPGADNNELPFL